MNNSPLDPGPWDNCLVGTLETWPLADMLLWLHQTQRSAMVRIGIGLGAGVIFFKHGQLYRCEWGELSGEEALMALLALESGSYSLIQRHPPDALPNVSQPTAELLFQLTLGRDERAPAGNA